METLIVANQILQQLGGNRFITMTGVKNLVGDEKSITMKLPRNSSKAKYLKITYNGLDLYNMSFLSIKKIGSGILKTDKVEVEKEFNDVYADMMCNIFESITGLKTRLF